MSIRVRCPACSKGYAAPDNMLGRRIKCRNCSNTFTVTAAPPQAGPGRSDSMYDEAIPTEADAGIAPGAAPAARRAGLALSSLSPALDPPDLAFTDIGSDPDSVFRTAFAGFKPKTRPNYIYKFPTAAALDRYLPFALTGIGLVWMVVETFRGASDAPGWVGWMRAALLLMLLGGVIFPLTSTAARLASRKLKFDLPPQPRWRMFAAFVVPFALAVSMWLTAGNFNGMMVGGLFGLVIGLGTTWLLLRLEPEEAPAALGMVGSAAAVAGALVVTLVWGANAITVAAVEDMKDPTTLAASPFGPGMSWAKPKPKSTEEYVPLPPTPSGDGSPQPPATVAANGGTKAPDADVSTSGHARTLTTVPAVVTLPPVTPPPAVVAPATVPSTPVVVTPLAPVAPPEPPVDLFVTKVRDARSPLVGEVTQVRLDGVLIGVVPTLTPSPTALVIKSSQTQEDPLDVWSFAPLAERKRQRPPFVPGPSRGYAVTPSGALMFRIVAFPTLSIEVWSNDENNVVRQLPLPERNAQPIILGALGEDRLLVRWDQRAYIGAGIEVLDVRTGQASRQVTLVDYVRGPGNGAVAPDGKTFANIGTPKDKPSVMLYALAGAPAAAPRQVPITGLDPKWATDPAAMSFSPDGKRLAILFQHADMGMVQVVRLADNKTIAQHLLPAGVLPPAPAEVPNFNMPGMDSTRPGDIRQLSWIGDGQAMLVRGDVILDSDTGRVLGHTGATGVLNQWVYGTTAVLTYKEKFELRLAHLQLKVPANAAPDPARTPASFRSP